MSGEDGFCCESKYASELTYGVKAKSLVVGRVQSFLDMRVNQFRAWWGHSGSGAGVIAVARWGVRMGDGQNLTPPLKKR